MPKHIVVVGASVAGLSAAIAAKTKNPEVKVTVFDKDRYAPYRRPDIVGVIEGVFRSVKGLEMYLRETRKLGVKLVKGAEVANVNPDSRVLNVKHVGNVKYDSLVLATGAEAVKPEIEGSDLEGVFTCRKLGDVLEIVDYIRRRNVRNVVVVGASFVALLLVEALARRGLKTGIVVRSRVLRKLIEPDQSTIIEKHLSAKGVSVYKKVTVEKILGSREVEKVVLSSGETVKVDMVVFAIGAKPNIDLAKKAKCRIVRGIVDVDEFMKTSVEEIYAAGDCAYSWDVITGGKAYFPNAMLASTYGKIAGLNALGLNVKAPKTLRIQFEKIFELNIVSCGYTQEEARRAGLNAKTISITKDVKRKYPLWGRKILGFSITVNGKGKIIGVEAVGMENIVTLMHPYIYAIRNRLKVDEVEELHPPILSLSRILNLRTLI